MTLRSALRTVGHPEVSLSLAASANSLHFVDTLTSTYPALSTMLPRCALAINGEYVRGAAPIADGDEIAVLPPMSGG